jgi:carbonic anhydrase
MTNGEGKTLWIGCMDFRLNRMYGKGFYLRNAGGSVEGFKTEIKKLLEENPDIKNIRVLVHRDCGGLKAASTVLRGGELGLSKDSGELFENSFVRYFREADLDGTDMEGMEEYNHRLQERAIREIVAQAGRSDVSIGVTNLAVPPGHADVVSIVIGQSNNTYSYLAAVARLNINETYFIHADNPADIMPSLELAIRVMGKRKIIFMANGKDSHPVVADFVSSKRVVELLRESRTSSTLLDCYKNKSRATG